MKKYIEFGHSYDQIAGVFCEERKGVGLDQRINPFEVRRRNGVLNFEVDMGATFAEAEKRGVDNMLELAKDGYGLIFWFSPAGGEYIGGRVVVARVASVEGDNVALKCRGLVVKKSPEEMLRMAQEVMAEGGISMDGIENPEDLRSQPVGINLDGEDWITFGRRITGMPVVWQRIARGEDIENKRRIEIEVVEVVGEIQSRGIKVNKEWWLENLMAQRGYQLNPTGNHGGSALAEENKEKSVNLVYSRGQLVTAETRGAKQCQKCGAWYVGEKCQFC